jgi:fluoroacetyl-CoA thioesterase
MKEALKPGIRDEHKFVVPQSKTVPALYPDSDKFVAENTKMKSQNLRK